MTLILFIHLSFPVICQFIDLSILSYQSFLPSIHLAFLRCLSLCLSYFVPYVLFCVFSSYVFPFPLSGFQFFAVPSCFIRQVPKVNRTQRDYFDHMFEGKVNIFCRNLLLFVLPAEKYSLIERTS